MEKSGVVIFDLETKKSFEEVGGKNNLGLLGVSVLAAYSYRQDKFFVFEERELNQFEKLLKEASLVAGFNIRDFDLPVLQPYFSSFNLKILNILDLIDDVTRGVGFRVGLDNLSQASLGLQKSADGLQALKWYKEGKMKEIKDYCLQDVRMTRELFEYGRKNGHVLFFSRETRQRVAIPVFWNSQPRPNVSQILKSAFQQRRSVEIDYVTRRPENSSGTSPRNLRLVDIYKLDSHSFEGFCHLRKAKRVFKLDRVLSASLTKRTYQLDNDVQSVLI